jgi:putative MATE family efflux protein
VKKILAILSQALKDTEYDYTKGSINKALVLLAIPMIFEMVLESTFAIVDIFFVGKIASSAVAIVGTVEGMVMIIESFAIGLAVATTAIIARRIGEHQIEKAKIAAVNAILLAIVISIAIGLTVVFNTETFLKLLGCSEDLIEIGTSYTQIILGLNIFLFLLFVNNAVFRGAGNATIAMRTLWLANGLNIILDPLLIFGFGSFAGFGLEGAAIATCIGRGIGVAYQLYHFFNGKSIIKITFSDILVNLKLIKELVRLSVGGAGQFLISTASWIFLIYIINTFGEKAMAGYTYAIRIIIFCILPSWGLANAVATLVGQNLGANQPGRAEKTVWKAGVYNMVFLFILSIIIFIFSADFISIFEKDKEVIQFGTNTLKIISLGYIAYAYQMVIGQAFNGAGDTTTPSLLNFVFLWLVQVPLAYLLAYHTDFEVNGVFMAIGISSTLLALTAIYIFRKGKWKLIEV